MPPLNEDSLSEPDDYDVTSPDKKHNLTYNSLNFAVQRNELVGRDRTLTRFVKLLNNIISYEIFQNSEPTS